MMHSLLILFNQLVELVIWAVVISAVLSWLIAFDVFSPRNQIPYRIAMTLEALTAPLLNPLRRFLPAPAGIDFSPIVLILLLIFLRNLVGELYFSLS